jgi:hypothetical protein
MTEPGTEKLSLELCSKRAHECRTLAHDDGVRRPHCIMLEHIAELGIDWRQG